MPIDDRFERALRSEDPIPRLRSLAASILEEGEDPAAVLERFNAVREHLREADREADEDAVMDVMDFLVGWCSPHMRLDAEQPSFLDPPASLAGDQTSATPDELSIFSPLYEQYPAIIAAMKSPFSSHQFIGELARRNQKAYIEALYYFRGTRNPFMNLHRVLAVHLNTLPHLVKRAGSVSSADSRDIFGNPQGCATWQKVG
jgi:hypothetical protein